MASISKRLQNLENKTSAKKLVFSLIFISVFIPFLNYGQTYSREDAGLRGDEGATSGFFETSSPINYPFGASSWWHLLDVRHSNIGNNYAMQFSGSFFDQNLYFRKTANSATQPWSRILTETTGKVGIGTTSPFASLDILNNISSSAPTGVRILYQGSWGTPAYATDFRFLDIASTEEGKVLQLGPYGLGLGYDPPKFHSADRLYVNGNVGIGTITPTEKLSVNGNIRAKEIKVETSNWPDYVFDEDYRVLELPELERFIKINKHLPDVPSASTIKQDGLALGEMNKILLKKVEELTLHLIEKDKVISKLIIRMDEFEKSVRTTKANYE